MRSKFKNERLEDYQSESARKKYLVSFGAEKEIFIGGKKIPPKAFGKFVMDAYGNIYMDIESPKNEFSLLKHSSFLAGGHVAAAGEWSSAGNYALDWINFSSGHYLPQDDHAKNFIEELKSRGLEKIRIKENHSDHATRAAAKLKLAGLDLWMPTFRKDVIIIERDKYLEKRSAAEKVLVREDGFNKIWGTFDGRVWLKFKSTKTVYTDFDLNKICVSN